MSNRYDANDPRDVSVECDGCLAPCCQNIYLSLGHADGSTTPMPDAKARQIFTAHAGTILRVIRSASNGETSVFECGALVGGRCSVYETRPGLCRVYDCRLDEARMDEDDEDELPRYAWPRAWVKGSRLVPG